MNSTQKIAKQYRDVFFGGNWTFVNMKDTLSDVDWVTATTKIHNLNSIAALVFHIDYYVQPILGVLRGGPLTGSDKYSFEVPAISSEEEWQSLVSKALADAQLLAGEIEKLDESKLDEIFGDPKYGDHYRNLHGLIEHTHYHLGQISLIKKMIKEQSLGTEE